MSHSSASECPHFGNVTNCWTALGDGCICLTANEIATLLWLMRRGRQRFVEASNSIRTMSEKGVVRRHGHWPGYVIWTLDDVVWAGRAGFLQARRILPTPIEFPDDGVFV